MVVVASPHHHEGGDVCAHIFSMPFPDCGKPEVAHTGLVKRQYLTDSMETIFFKGDNLKG